MVASTTSDSSSSLDIRRRHPSKSPRGGDRDREALKIRKERKSRSKRRNRRQRSQSSSDSYSESSSYSRFVMDNLAEEARRFSNEEDNRVESDSDD